jgi:cystathionine beta-lyase family protein involved in aluminum resistance
MIYDHPNFGKDVLKNVFFESLSYNHLQVQQTIVGTSHELECSIYSVLTY